MKKFPLFTHVEVIHHAIKNYNVKQYVYSKPSPNNVLKYQSETILFFDNMEVKDLLYAINQNLKTNNLKASNLIYSFRTFKIGNITTALLVGILCFSLLFVKDEADSGKLAGPIEFMELIL